jgi:hypothetical protein
MDKMFPISRFNYRNNTETIFTKLKTNIHHHHSEATEQLYFHKITGNDVKYSYILDYSLNFEDNSVKSYKV